MQLKKTSPSVVDAIIECQPVKALLLDDLPEILSAAHVVAYLRPIIGRNAVYELLHSQRIRNRRVNQRYLIHRNALKEFVECRDESEAAGIPR